MAEAGGGVAQWAAGVLDDRLTKELAREATAAQHECLRIESAVAAGDEHDWAGRYVRFGIRDLSREKLLLCETHGAWSRIGVRGREALRTRTLVFDDPTLRMEYSADRLIHKSRESPWPRVLTLVRWGDWRYLVSPNQLEEFCHDVNAGAYLPARYLSRPARLVTREDLMRGRPESSTPPVVPAAVRHRLLAQPIEAAASRVAEAAIPSSDRYQALLRAAASTNSVEFRWVITLDSGRIAGVLEGMRFYSVRREAIGVGRVTLVGPNSADILWVELFHAGGDNSAPEPGNRFSTKSPTDHRGLAEAYEQEDVPIPMMDPTAWFGEVQWSIVHELCQCPSTP